MFSTLSLVPQQIDQIAPGLETIHSMYRHDIGRRSAYIPEVWRATRAMLINRDLLTDFDIVVALGVTPGGLGAVNPTTARNSPTSETRVPVSVIK